MQRGKRADNVCGAPGRVSGDVETNPPKQKSPPERGGHAKQGRGGDALAARNAFRVYRVYRVYRVHYFTVPTSARTAARICSGSFGHASTTDFKSGESGAALVA